MGTSSAPETPTTQTPPTLEALAAEVLRLASIVDHNVALCLIKPQPQDNKPTA